ncbi:UPF0481 protein At3g47200-like [Camellia sinensis]|uniref:UPF0481 protein At3g47200-like n=1 Tax=Camellia sinensis TaxID=4442 RepID=UPI00103571EE|nr:UPF0481 protein At3g47200-like [Camellia sinensis]
MENFGTSRHGTTSRNGDASIDVEVLVKSIKEKLAKLSCPSPDCCIYKVHNKFRNINEEAYTPFRVSIGPLHHGKEGLEDMEDHKWRYFNYFMQRSQKSLEELVKFMGGNEERIRGYYAETISLNSNKFLEIILVDAAFIIEVLLRYWFDDLITPNDRIFRKPWMINDISQDLLLLENQLPFFVIQDLFEMTNINLVFNENETFSYPFVCLTLHWFLNSNKIQERPVLQDINPLEVKHFLDLLRSCLVPRKSLRHTKGKFEFIPSATELHEAGVKFKVSSSKSLFDIKFSGNVLEIPQKKINDSTERLLRNIIAYEQCHCKVKFVTDYTVILVYLINTSKDVELLVKAKVVENWLSDNNDVSNLFNRLGKEVILDTNAYYFTKLHKELNDYYKIRGHKWKATLRHNYCNTPWQVLSIFVAAILLGLTFIQSLCSLVSCNK